MVMWQHHRPLPVLQGQVAGVALSFITNFGVFSGASGVLGALSRGVASLGTDNKTAEERAAARQQRSIGNVGEGFAEGGDALAQGFYRGFTGLVTKPLQGARTGVGGVRRLLCLPCMPEHIMPELFCSQECH
jgi:vacuolar protein sorting-associated protein 13A/C